MLCVPLCELQSQLEQALLHRRIEGDLVAVHGARDEPHGQVIVVREGEEEEIKPGWIDLKCSLYSAKNLAFPHFTWRTIKSNPSGVWRNASDILPA